VNDREKQTEQPPANDPRRPYEAPRLLKKRSVSRVTLFSSGSSVVSVSSLTAA
jgi:hypothetical protein